MTTTATGPPVSDVWSCGTYKVSFHIYLFIGVWPLTCGPRRCARRAPVDLGARVLVAPPPERLVSLRSTYGPDIPVYLVYSSRNMRVY